MSDGPTVRIFYENSDEYEFSTKIHLHFEFSQKIRHLQNFRRKFAAFGTCA